MNAEVLSDETSKPLERVRTILTDFRPLEGWDTPRDERLAECLRLIAPLLEDADALRAYRESAQAEYDARQAAAKQAAEVKALALALRDALRRINAAARGEGDSDDYVVDLAEAALARADALLGTVTAEEAFTRTGAAE